jgi:hypothetical protein
VSNPHIKPAPDEPLPVPGAPPPAPEPDPQPGDPPAPPQPGEPIPDSATGLVDPRRLAGPGLLEPPHLETLTGPTEACDEPNPEEPALPLG